MTDDDGHAWLDEHQRRAEQLIYFFYALAGLSALAIAVPIKWPKTSTSLVITTILLGAVVLGMGGYIAYAGGKIRHKGISNRAATEEIGRGVVASRARSLKFSRANNG
jgi:hypothetical protein